MLEIIEQLLVLQEKDQRIKTLQTELDNIPSDKAALEAEIAELARKLDLARTESRENEVERKKLQVEAQAKRDAIARYRQQQLQTKKNEEYSALNHEIEVAEGIVVEIEDRELALMEKFEALQPALAQADARHAEERGRVRERIAEMDERRTRIGSRLAELQAERANLASAVDDDTLDHYQRLFRSKGGTAVVPMERGVCQGCHMKATTQTLVDVKASRELTSCPQCGRFIYYSE